MALCQPPKACWSRLHQLPSQVVDMSREHGGEHAQDASELWRHANPSTTQMFKFLELVNAKYHLELADYPALHKWSVDNVAAFWAEAWHFLGIRASKPYDEVGKPAITDLWCPSPPRSL